MTIKILLLLPCYLWALSWDKVYQKIDYQFPNIPTITVDSLHLELNKNDSNILIVDTREQVEYQVSHIKNAITYPVFLNKLKQEEIAKNTKIILYCSVGYRSSQKVQKLIQQGYNNSYNLKGSIFEWANKGFQVYQKDSVVLKVHPFNKKWGILLNDSLHFYYP